MITDKQIIDTLKNIKKHCINGCYNCPFQNDMKNIDTVYNCQVEELVESIYPNPKYWDIEKLERIIKQ